MSWFATLFGRSGPDPRDDESEFAHLVGDCKALLAKQIKLQIGKAKSHSQLVPREFVRRCERLFAENLDDIAEKVVQT